MKKLNIFLTCASLLVMANQAETMKLTLEERLEMTIKNHSSMSLEELPSALSLIRERIQDTDMYNNERVNFRYQLLEFQDPLLRKINHFIKLKDPERAYVFYQLALFSGVTFIEEHKKYLDRLLINVKNLHDLGCDLEMAFHHAKGTKKDYDRTVDEYGFKDSELIRNISTLFTGDMKKEDLICIIEAVAGYNEEWQF